MDTIHYTEPKFIDVICYSCEAEIDLYIDRTLISDDCVMYYTANTLHNKCKKCEEDYSNQHIIIENTQNPI